MLQIKLTLNGFNTIHEKKEEKKSGKNSQPLILIQQK